MRVSLTNLSPVPVPITTDRLGGTVATLEPGAAFTIDDEEETVVTIGDNPSFKEDIDDFLEDVVEAFRHLLTFWREHATSRRAEDGKVHPVVKLRIDNRGTSGLRVVLGDDTDGEFEIQPGATSEAEALDYVELRELVSGEDPAADEDQAG